MLTFVNWFSCSGVVVARVTMLLLAVLLRLIYVDDDNISWGGIDYCVSFLSRFYLFVMDFWFATG